MSHKLGKRKRRLLGLLPPTEDGDTPPIVTVSSANQSGGQTAHTIINQISSQYTGKISAHKTEKLLSPSTAPLRQMEIGNSGTHFVFEGPQAAPLLVFFDRGEVTLESIDGELKVSTKIFDKEGKLVAQLVKNEWKIAPPPKTWDRNYTTNALEVLNDEGQIILQIVMLPDRIQLQGEWWNKEKNGLRMVKSNDPSRPGGLLCFGKNGTFLPGTTDIEAMFVYPSETHLGELK